MLNEIENQIMRGISAAKAYQHIENICRFGNRLAGSEADNKAAEYFAATCSEYGLYTYFEEFETDCFEPITCELSLVEPESKNIEYNPMRYSPSTSEEGITSELVDVGAGKEEDYMEKDTKNKIVLLRRGFEMTNFLTQVCIASKHGASGVIVANYESWPHHGILEPELFGLEKRLLPIEPNPIPAINISLEDGQYLRECLLKYEKVKMHLRLQAITEKRVTQNVRCLLPGTLLPEERVILGAHHDTENNPGADDNASGLGVLLELARILSAHPCKRTIEFYSPGCEEGRSIGSWEYCKRHKSDLRNIVAFINVDMVGGGGDLCIMTEGRWPDKKIIAPEWLCLFVGKVAKELNYKTKFSANDLGTGDEGRFIDAGVPSVFLITPWEVHFHSMLDIPEYVDPNSLKVVGEISGLAAWRLANR
jgi:aminopeptidase YwaD